MTAIFSGMSAAEIIMELPKLSEADRRAVLHKLWELGQRDALDRMEKSSPPTTVRRPSIRAVPETKFAGSRPVSRFSSP